MTAATALFLYKRLSNAIGPRFLTSSLSLQRLADMAQLPPQAQNKKLDVDNAWQPWNKKVYEDLDFFYSHGLPRYSRPSLVDCFEFSTGL